MGERRDGPVVIDLGAGVATPADPSVAPPVPDPDMPPSGQALRTAARLGSRPLSGPARLFLAAAAALAVFAAGVAAWDFAAGLLARNPVLGALATGLVGLTALAALVLAGREAAGIARLRRLDGLRREAGAALGAGDLAAARKVAAGLDRLYADRPALAEGRARLAARQGDILDASALLDLAETALLADLDAGATRAVEGAARQVATVTALVPLALADVAAALVANLRMIRQVAEIYGGRAGTLGSWRLARGVVGHLVATGALAAGDDLIGSVAGGGLVSRLSRRFGEGVVNGALTARVGVAAIEVCRPLPFRARPAPRVSALVGRALAGLFDRG